MLCDGYDKTVCGVNIYFIYLTEIKFKFGIFLCCGVTSASANKKCLLDNYTNHYV